MYQSDDSVGAARHNQLDRRTNGIIGFTPGTQRTDGQAALQFTGTNGVLDLEGADALIGNDPVTAPGSPVQLSVPESTQWRVDHIYISEDGAFSVAEGKPGSAEVVVHGVDSGDVTHEIVEDPRVRPKGSAMAQVPGVLVWTIRVPPESANQNITEDHVHDRRRAAIEVQAQNPWQMHITPFQSIEAGNVYHNPFGVPGNSVLEIYWVTFLDETSGISPGNNLTLQLFSMNRNEVLWEATDPPEGGLAGEPLEVVDTGSGSSSWSWTIDSNNMESGSSMGNPIGVQAAYALNPE